MSIAKLNKVANPEPILLWLFRIGFASVFLINSIIALLDPSGFIKLMQSSLMGQFIHDFTPWVRLIVLNDAVLGVLILSGRYSQYVLAWSGLWFLAITVLKLSDLLR